MAPATAVPPALPPSVEEAYRRKCIQLKQRTSEVEEANDAARLRLARLKRQVEKMRLERAFLLEQLAKRTSTNVEDSDGSPSPPPTPKEKPLRIKRGHRKPSAFANAEAPSSNNAATPGSTFISQNLLARSPSGSEAPSAAPQGGDASTSRTNGVRKRKYVGGFELYSNETRSALADELAASNKRSAENDDDVHTPATAEDVEKELLRRWENEFDDARRNEYEDKALLRHAELKEQDQLEAEAEAEAAAKRADADGDGSGDRKSGSAEPERSRAGGDGEERGSSSARRQQQQQEDEDVEMGNYDTDEETQGEKPEE